MKYGLIILASLFCINVNADVINAVTTTGKSVLLHENGKWEFDKITKKQGEYDFRKVHWGMSKAQVKTTETGKIFKDDDVLGYEGKVVGLDTLIAYIFVNDKLVRAKYIFIEKHTNKNDYLTDYTAIQKILGKKYGEAKDDKTYWKNDLYKSEYQSWGMAIAVGHLSKYANWKTPNSEVWLSLNGDNYKISHSAEYSSIKLSGLESAKSEDESAAQF